MENVGGSGHGLQILISSEGNLGPVELLVKKSFGKSVLQVIFEENAVFAIFEFIYLVFCDLQSKIINSEQEKVLG